MFCLHGCHFAGSWQGVQAHRQFGMLAKDGLGYELMGYFSHNGPSQYRIEPHSREEVYNSYGRKGHFCSGSGGGPVVKDASRDRGGSVISDRPPEPYRLQVLNPNLDSFANNCAITTAPRLLHRSGRQERAREPGPFNPSSTASARSTPAPRRCLEGKCIQKVPTLEMHPKGITYSGNTGSWNGMSFSYQSRLQCG